MVDTIPNPKTILNAFGEGINPIANLDPQKGTIVDSTTLGQSQYNFSYLTFPGDLGQSYMDHYMVININVPTDSKGGLRGGLSGKLATVTPLTNDFSKVDTLRFSAAGAISGAAQGELGTLKRGTRRIAQSIALFMPSGLTFTGVNEYENISLTAIAGAIGTGAINAITSLIPSNLGGRALGTIFNTAAAVAGQVAKISGNPINPRVEILFSTTTQRQFTFEVLMAPRNEKESITIKNIIQTLRYHAAPEISLATLGLTFIPPAEFDITFFHKGVENTNIPRINTCVLERIDVDVAPQGAYATFSNGYPVAVRMNLGFREIEMVHKLRVLQGF